MMHAVAPPQVRFFLLLLPRMLARRCTARRAAAYAFALAESGSHRLADWCWSRAIELASDEEACHYVVDLCVRAGRTKSAVALAHRYYAANGLLRGEAVRLVGLLALHDDFDAALTAYDYLLTDSGDDLVEQWPAPAWPQPPSGSAVKAVLAKGIAQGEASVSAGTYLCLARLCFSFGALDVSAGLFNHAEEYEELHEEDLIAYAYALLRTRQVASLTSIDQRIRDLSPPDDPDWQILLATVLFARGFVDAAAEVVERAMLTRMGNHIDRGAIARECRGIVHLIGNNRQTTSFGHWTARTITSAPNGRRKVFVCGNGWSGSGALYDALTDYEGFAEAPDTPMDRFVNPCTGNEMMLIQGASGLGSIWRKARDTAELSRFDLWELFRCHLLGSGAIGFTEHKGAKTATDLCARFGLRYTGIFRAFFRSFGELPSPSGLDGLHRILIEATEAFAAVIADNRDDACVVFNNAVFGSNIDMLEIFSNFRAAVVVRDPLDQFADRRNQDLKHWMTARRFVHVYRHSREAFHLHRDKLSPVHAQKVREVEFERFVLEGDYRDATLSWLLGGRDARRSRRRFEAERSAANIGIHLTSLSPDERQYLAESLKQWIQN